jgi:hypothetical protein
MNKNYLESRAYIKPECEIVDAESERFICTSVSPHSGSQQEDWDPDEEVDGGEYEFE